MEEIDKKKVLMVEVRSVGRVSTPLYYHYTTYYAYPLTYYRVEEEKEEGTVG